MKCPSFKLLVDFWEGSLSPKAEEKVKAHLSEGCESCAQDLKFLEEVLGGRRESSLKQPPKFLVQKALTAFERGRESGLVRRMVANLALDNRRLPEYAEIRTGGIKPIYLLYRAQEIDLDLLVQSSSCGEKRCILGQVSDMGGRSPIYNMPR